MIDCALLVRDGLSTCCQDTSSSYAMYNDPYQRTSEEGLARNERGTTRPKGC